MLQGLRAWPLPHPHLQQMESSTAGNERLIQTFSVKCPPSTKAGTGAQEVGGQRASLPIARHVVRSAPRPAQVCILSHWGPSPFSPSTRLVAMPIASTVQQSARKPVPPAATGKQLQEELAAELPGHSPTVVAMSRTFLSPVSTSHPSRPSRPSLPAPVASPSMAHRSLLTSARALENPIPVALQPVFAPAASSQPGEDSTLIASTKSLPSQIVSHTSRPGQLLGATYLTPSTATKVLANPPSVSEQKPVLDPLILTSRSQYVDQTFAAQPGLRTGSVSPQKAQRPAAAIRVKTDNYTSPQPIVTRAGSKGTTCAFAWPVDQAKSAVESQLWTQLEHDLFTMSGGAYDPRAMAKKRRVQLTSGVAAGATGVNIEILGRVSIVAPTLATRQHYHENLWRCFDAQTWPDKELIVVETYEDTPSAFLRAKAKVDSRIVHIVMHRAEGTDFTVGLKRNMTLHLASGEYVVNFDDDDLYAPTYVQRIVSEMQAKDLVGVTLSAWYNYYIGKGICTFSDPSGWEEWANDKKDLDNILYGYGFSYTHKRQPSLLFPYPNVGFAEDAPFFLNLKEFFGENRVILWKDVEGLCVHIMHTANTAQVLGTRDVSAIDIANLAVTDLKPFQKMIDSDFFRFSPWRPPVRYPAASVSLEVGASGVAVVVAEEDDEDVRPRLRGSTLDAARDFAVEGDLSARPKVDSWRNPQLSSAVSIYAESKATSSTGGPLQKAPTMCISASHPTSTTPCPAHAARVEQIPARQPALAAVTSNNAMQFWTPLEQDLFTISGGAYNPSVMAKKRRVQAARGVAVGTGVQIEVPGRVSIVAPTMATRQHYHDNLWRCFNAQTWPDKELIIIETYQDTPSAYFQAKAKLDSRIVHIVMHRAAGTDFTVGLKRNMTLHMASGEFVVNFDDDDLYAPTYVQTIVCDMIAFDLVGVTLSAWYNYYIGRGLCTFSDPSCWNEWASDAEELDNILYGYGFSYTHRREPSLSNPYPNVGFAEDAPFFLKLKELYGDHRVILMKDIDGLCMHIMHRANTAQVLGTRTISAENIANLAVTDLKPFQKMIDHDFFRFSPWRPPVRYPAASVTIEVASDGGSVSSAEEDEEADVRPRLRGSLLDGAAEFSTTSEVPVRPQADTWRN